MEEYRRPLIRALLVAAAFVMTLVVLTVLLTSRMPREELPPCPLDAVRYEAPAFADDVPCYKIMDRSNGQVWWRVRIDGEWADLEVGA